MNNFEERLARLEELSLLVKRNDVPLDKALAAFEEGIKLSRSLESDLEKIESRVEILTNSANLPAETDAEDGAQAAGSPKLELFIA